MKKILILATIAIVFASCVKNDPYEELKGSELYGQLFLNEVNGTGGAASLDAEKYVELYNSTNNEINLKDFVLDYGGKETWRGRVEDKVPAKGYKLIKGSKTTYPGMSQGLSSRNANVNLTLLDATGAVVDYYEKVDDLVGDPVFESLDHMRIPDGGEWYFVALSSQSPGATNLTSPTHTDVKGKMKPMEKGLKIEEITVTPASPTPDNDVTIVAKVTDINPISSVVLKWKKDNVAQTDISMTKDGSEYTAIIAKQTDGTVVIWTVEATNNKAAKVSTSGTITFSSHVAYDYTKLKINEVNGYNTDDQKFYELINMGTEPINLAGCKLFYNANGSTGGVLPVGKGSETWEGCPTQIIGGGQLLSLIGRNNECSFTTGLTAGRILMITLEDPDGNLIDQFIRAEDTGPYAFTDKSFSRIPDGTGPFYFTTQTPNATNGTTTTGLTLVPQTQGPPAPDYTKLKINEVNGAPDQKWFELYNTGTVEISLEGVKGYYSDSEPANYILSWTGAPGQTIPAGGYFSTRGTILNTGLSANNANIRLQLRAPNGTAVLDTYEKLKDISSGYSDIRNKSHARIPDGTGSWYYTTNNTGTPGATNGSSTTGYTKFGEEDGGSTVTVDYTKLVLTEVSGNNKYVEIYNSGTESIPLAGVKLQRNDGPSGGSEWVGTASDAIPAGAYRLFLFNSYTAGLDANPAYVGWTVGSGISAGQILKVAIVDPSATEVSVFVRGEVPLPAWGNNTGITQNSTDSYSRMSDGTWAYAAPTPGAVNGAKTAPIMSPGYLTDDAVKYAKLVLTEVSGNNKYVEIYNSGTEEIPLAGVKLQRNDGPSGGSEWVGTASDAIPAGAYRLFLFNSYTPSTLNTNPAYVGWTVGSGISAGQILKVAIVSPKGNAISTFIRGDIPLPAWGNNSGVTQNSTDTYSRMADNSWAYATATPGAVNGAKTTDILTPGYLTAQP